jgi:hypothetical protein
VHAGYDYAETVNAAYTTLSQTVGRFSAQAGLRLEHLDAHRVATNSWLNGSHSETLGSNFTMSLRSTGRLTGSTNLNLRHEARDAGEMIRVP